MTGEREDFLDKTQYGDLNMRSYVIGGNEINAFYDTSDNLVFVLDNTINQTKTNVLLVINPDGDKKWDEILSGQYGVDLETIRPKQDNKYQKLDIEYSGLSVYNNLVKAFVAGDDVSEHLVQLNILRDSAVRHSAMTRLNTANEIIAKTNVTIVKTKESIVRLQNRIKTLRAKLTATKKEIGKVSTKQSAAKILKLESQIEATNEKLKAAQKRLESARKRLENATVDAELASDLLNQPVSEITKPASKNKSVMVAPEYPVQKTDGDNFASDDNDDENEITEEDDSDDFDTDEIDDEYDDSDNDIKPLFDENPNNLNEDIAFKPISFDMPPDMSNMNTDTDKTESVPVFTPEPMFNTDSEETEIEEFIAPDITNISEQRPVLESITPSNVEEQKPVLESITPVSESKLEQPMVDIYSRQSTETNSNDVPSVAVQPSKPARPISPFVPVSPVPAAGNNDVSVVVSQNKFKSTLLYYILLIILIVLSVFTLWLYQKNMGSKTKPVLTATIEETQTVKEPVDKSTEAYEFEDEITEQNSEPPAVEKEPEVVEDVTDTEVVTDDTLESELDDVELPENDFVEDLDDKSNEDVTINTVSADVVESDTDTVTDVTNNVPDVVDKPVYNVYSKAVVSGQGQSGNEQEQQFIEDEEEADFNAEEYYE